MSSVAPMNEHQQSDGQRSFTERFEVAGANLVDVIKQIIDEGNAKRITIRNKEGKELLAIPMSWGVAGAAAGVILAPLLALAAAIGGAVAELKIDVERYEEPGATGSADTPGDPDAITG